LKNEPNLGVGDQRPKYRTPKDGGNKDQIITPIGKTVNRSLFDNPIAQKFMRQEQIYFPQTLKPNVRDTWMPTMGRGYWEDPKRIARYHNFIRTAPPNWQQPEWLDIPGIEAAHKYFTETQGADWTQWKYLPEEDDATQFLRNTMQQPPLEALFPTEIGEFEQQQQINTWDDLYPYQRAWETITTPQPLTADNPTDRPLGSIITGNAVRTGLQAASGAGMGALLTKGLIIAGVATGSTAIATGAAIGAAVFGLGAAYQLITGKPMPIVGKLVDTFGFTTIFGQATEQAIGTAAQIMDDDTLAVIDSWSDLEEEWKAAAAYYETAPTEKTITHGYQQIAETINLEGARESGAEAGEVYRWDMGFADPQKLPEGYQFGVNALHDIVVKIEAGADPVQAVNDYTQQFGTQGMVNDFVIQNILDPLNYTPSITQGTMRVIGNLTDNPKILASFDKITPTNLIVDGLPMPLNMLAPAISGGRLQGSAGLLDGVLKYQTFIKTGVIPGANGPDDFIPPKDYTQADKVLGDLTDEGLPKDFIPLKPIEDGPLKGVRNWFNKLVNLTPQSKAEVSYANITQHFDVLGNLAGDDIGLYIKIMKTSGQVDAAMTGEAFAKMVNPEGMSGNLLEPQNFISPIGAAMAEGLRSIDAEKLIDEIHTNKWVTPGERRALLNRIADTMGKKPGEILDDLFVKNLDLAEVLKKSAAEQGIKDMGGITTDLLKEQLEVFTGKDALPIAPDQFKVEVGEAVKKKLAEFMVARFGLEPDGKFMRFAGMLKDIQSLLVLGFNPGYMVNNFVNNIVTRASDGLLGMMTRPQINKYLERFEILPTRMDMGLGKDSLAKQQFAIDANGRITKVSDSIKQEKDLLSAAQKTVRGVRNKIGVFGVLSGKIEQSESRQAYMSALKHMQSSMWVREVGIRPLPDHIKQVLGEEATDQLYRAIEKSINSKEIDQNAYGEGNLTATEIVYKVAESFVLNNTDVAASKQMLVEVFTAHGILDELDGLLVNAKTPDDIDNAFIQVQNSMQNKIMEMRAQELIDNIEAKKVLIESEGITAAMGEVVDAEIDLGFTWAQYREDMNDLWARKPNMDGGEWTRQYKMLKQKYDWKFREQDAWRISTMDAIFTAMGFAKDNPNVKVILGGMKETSDNWSGFYKTADQKWADFIEKIKDVEYGSDSYKLLYDETAKEVQDLSESAWELELSNLRKADEAFIALARNKPLARQWRAQGFSIRSRMIDDMRGQWQDIKNNPPDNLMQKNNRWSEFVQKKYIPEIIALKSNDALIRNMMERVVTTEADLAKGIQQKIIDNPIDDSVPPVLRTKIQQEAEAMLKEFGMGDAGKRIKIMENDPLSKIQDVDHVEAMSSTNVSWYRKLYADNDRVNRGTVENAIRYLVDGNNKTNQYTGQIKEIIINRLLGSEARDYDMGIEATGQKLPGEYYHPDIEGAYLLGGKDIAAAELNAVLNSDMAGDVDTFFTDPQLQAEIINYWSNDFLPKNTIKEMVDQAMPNLSYEMLDGIMDFYDLKAQQWARDTGNHPREFYKKVLGSIKYVDEPIQYLKALYETGELPEVWHYSKLQRTIEGMPNRMSADQFDNWLKGKVKKEEIQDTGFDEYIKAKKKSGEMITKTEALDYLADNAVRVEEVINAVAGVLDERVVAREMALEDVSDYDRYTEYIDPSGETTFEDWKKMTDDERVDTALEFYLGDYLEKARTYIQDQMNITTKYGKPPLITEGNYENYRELLLTLPMKDPDIRVAQTSKGTYDVPDGSGNWIEFATEAEAIDYLSKNNPANKWGGYQSSHWDEPNVLAHIRFNDRIDADGKKVLYIEEIQSDWHQAGRKEGYQQLVNRITELPDGYKVMSNGEGDPDVLQPTYWVENENGQKITSLSYNRQSSINEAINTLNALVESGIPDASFKSSWNMLSMKRMIRRAVENGYDRVAWTPGEVQAERYNLANYVDEIKYDKTTNQLEGIKDGSVMLDKTVSPDKLSEYIGDDPTARIMDDPNKQVTLIGDDLKVGGEGMRGFYDYIMIHDTNKLIRKYGAEVGETIIKTKTIDDPGRLRYEVLDERGDPYDAFETMEAAQQAIQDIGEAGYTVRDAYTETEGDLAVHAFDITDDMRKMVYEGIPLYQRDLDLFSIANKYGIPTATKDGAPNNKLILNTINKYSDTKYKSIDDITPEVAVRALEAMRIEKGEPAVENPLVKGATQFDKDTGAANILMTKWSDLKTFVHENGHTFRRTLDGNDLEAVAKWTGLENAEELARLEQKFDNGTITDAERIRYEESEEKFADGFTKYMADDHPNLPQKIQAVFAKFAQWLRNILTIQKTKYDMDIDATIEVNGRQVLIRDVLDRMFVKIEGENPLGTTPQPMFQSKGMSETLDMYGYRMLDSIKDRYKREYQNYKSINVDTDIPADIRPEVVKWINQTKNDLNSTKYAAMNYAMAKRDQALINYSRRTGFDELISVPFPYIFWYTKSMINWAMRSIDQPKLYATYARYKDMQEKMERDGIPTRLRGKMRMNAPYLPDWMGGGLWQDPMRQLFPFAQLNDPVDRAAYLENSLRHETYNVINEMADDGKITPAQAEQAREAGSGDVWDMAMAEANSRLGTFNPMSLASIMATPAMYLTVPYDLMRGKPEKIQPTPFLKTTQAVETLTQDIPFLSGIGSLVGKAGDMTEGALRRIKMTPAVAMFGEYGDYYVDRQLANMVADGEVGIKEAKLAMVNRTGDIYAEAVNRVRQEVAMRVPGSAAVMAAKNGANIPQFAAAVFHSLNPSGLLPTGELEYLNLKDDYSHAWDRYNMGDKQALNTFLEENPVFEARMAIKDNPDERLQNFLVSEIWDRYMSLDSADKQLVRDQLGPQFQDAFMEQRVYDAIPIDKMAEWAHRIGAMVPMEQVTPETGQMPMVDMWDADAANSYQTYSDTRNKEFPNWFAIEQRYFDTPRNKQKVYLNDHPELLEYWEWKDQYRSAHPEIEPIMAYKSAQYQQENAMMKEQLTGSMPEELMVQLQGYILTGRNMGPGAWEALRYVWEKAGMPYGNLKKWVDEELVYMIR